MGGRKDVWLLANFKMHRWHSSGWMLLVLLAFAFTDASQSLRAQCSFTGSVRNTSSYMQSWQIARS